MTIGLFCFRHGISVAVYSPTYNSTSMCILHSLYIYLLYRAVGSNFSVVRPTATVAGTISGSYSSACMLQSSIHAFLKNCSIRIY